MVGKMRKFCNQDILSDKEIVTKKRLLKTTLLQMSQLDNIILSIESLEVKDQTQCDQCNNQLRKEEKSLNEHTQTIPEEIGTSTKKND